MTKEEILSALHDCVRKLGRNPRVRELRRMCGVTEDAIYKNFGSLAQALRAAKLEPMGSGFEVRTSTVLLDWAALARRMGRLPSARSYAKSGRYSTSPLVKCSGRWQYVPQAFLHFVHEEGIESEWDDVIQLISRKPAGDNRGKLRTKASPSRRWDQPVLLRDRPIYGEPLPMPGLACEPVSEIGVVYLFGMVAGQMGFMVQRMQTGFPDCEAMRRVEPGKWQRVSIEFEFESRNFMKHRHHADACDVIICWRHNWPECPERLEVIELSKVVRGMVAAGS
ncbi:MAG TPA: hypothetical protein VFK06_16265 [Candidatus Angelobacter sp.]|nr:hypothetical protein [Candidatus Angelobacter sp.]